MCELDDDMVYYCRSCHSLCVLVDEELADDLWDGSYCGKCNSTDIGTCTMDEWLAEEEKIAEQKRRAEWRK